MSPASVAILIKCIVFLSVMAGDSSRKSNCCKYCDWRCRKLIKTERPEISCQRFFITDFVMFQSVLIQIILRRNKQTKDSFFSDCNNFHDSKVLILP